MGGSGFDHLAPWDARSDHGDQRCGGARAVPRGERDRGDARPRLRVPELRRAAARAPVAAGPVHPRSGGGPSSSSGSGASANASRGTREPSACGSSASGGGRLPHPAADEMHGPDALASLLPEADIVSLHVRLDATTRGLLSREAIAAMKPGGVPRQHLAGGGRRRGGPRRRAPLRPPRRCLPRRVRDRAPPRREPALDDAERHPHPPTRPTTSSAGRAGSRSSSRTTSTVGALASPSATWSRPEHGPGVRR